MDQKIADYKAVIINGSYEDDVDGQINFVGRTDEYEYHIDALLDYARRKYPDENIFQRISDKCEPDVPIYFLVALDNVVYINVSGNRLSDYGMLFLPDEVSLQQKEAVYELVNGLKKARVDIVYDLTFKDGFTEGKEIPYSNRKRLEETLNDFWKFTIEKKSKR